MRFVAIMSLYATGRPKNGAAGFSSIRFAASSACSGRNVTIAFTIGLTRSICAMNARMTSVADISRDASMRASSRAGLKIMGSDSISVIVREMRIFKDIVFEAAHRLPNVPPSHRCYNLHGHTFKCRIECEGPLDARLGWVVDFADVDTALQPLIRQLDHRY